MRGVSHLKIVGLGVFASLAVAPAAHAALAGGISLSTETRPDLVSVQTREEGSTTPKRVSYCFDENVKPDGAPAFTGSDFELYGYDADSFEDANSAVLDVDHPNCVIATFPDNTDIKHYTAGGVDQGAVRNISSNKENLDNAQPNGTSIEQVGGGLTDAPDVIQVTVDASFNQLVYVFDRNVEPGSWITPFFLYYDAAGNRVFANAVAQDSSNRNILRVQFPDFGGALSVRDAVRAGFERDAVAAENDTGETSVRQTVAVVGQDGFTARPDLVNAKIVPNGDCNAVDYSFDQPVQINDIGAFELYSGDEDEFNGDSAQVLVSKPNTVRVWFTSIHDSELCSDAGETAVASVDDFFFGPNDAAVLGTNGLLRNGVQSVPLGNVRNVKGFTSAPDATLVTFDTDEGSATVTFDQDVQDAFSGGFDVVDRFGNVYVFQPQDVVLIDGNRVKLTLPAGTAQQAVGVVLHDSAVVGTNDEESVQQAIGRANQPVSPGPGPLVPTSPSQTPSNGSTGPGGTTTPTTTGAGGNTQAVSPASVNVSPAKSSQPSTKAGRIVSARVVRTKSGKYVLLIKVSSKAKSAKVRIRTVAKNGKVVRTTVKTIKTNKTVRISGLKLGKGQKLRASLVG